MTATIARLVLAMLLLPITGAVFLLCFAASIGKNGPSVAGVCVVWAVVYAFVGTYWILLWRSTVRWTPARVRNTTIASILSIACGVAASMMCHALNGSMPVQIAILLGGGCVPIVWTLATVLLWRETPAERAARMSRLAGSSGAIFCPTCGYNLSGLREARCPECGAAFTLDELAAAQPHLEEHPAEL